MTGKPLRTNSGMSPCRPSLSADAPPGVTVCFISEAIKKIISMSLIFAVIFIPLCVR